MLFFKIFFAVVMHLFKKKKKKLKSNYFFRAEGKVSYTKNSKFLCKWTELEF